MATAAVSQGDRSFVEEEYEDAVKHYTEALGLEPSSSTYEARANAYIKLEKYVEAAADATRAIALDTSNAKAYLRKGIACYYLEEYETALEALEQGMALSPETSAFKNWHRKCKAEIEDEAAEATPPAKPSVSAAVAPVPTPQPKPAAAAAPPAASLSAVAPVEPAVQQPKPAEQQQQPQSNGTSSSAEPSSSTAGALAPAAPAEFAGKYRHQWYQIQNKVVVDVYAKNMPKDRVDVKLDGGTHLIIRIKADPAAAAAAAEEQDPNLLEGLEYQLELDLYAPVVESGLRVEVLRSKIEISMAKADTSINWATLEKSGRVAAPNWSVPTDPALARQYPSSVKTPKDWSKVNQELAELEQKGELEDGDPLQNFFKKIFSQGDEDQRRAMMKSYVESNGTVLSTNWNEVGTKKVECTPPEGMELHKWSENM